MIDYKKILVMDHVSTSIKKLNEAIDELLEANLKADGLKWKKFARGSISAGTLMINAKNALENIRI